MIPAASSCFGSPAVTRSLLPTHTSTSTFSAMPRNPSTKRSLFKRIFFPKASTPYALTLNTLKALIAFPLAYCVGSDLLDGSFMEYMKSLTENWGDDNLFLPAVEYFAVNGLMGLVATHGAARVVQATAQVIIENRQLKKGGAQQTQKLRELTAFLEQHQPVVDGIIDLGNKRESGDLTNEKQQEIIQKLADFLFEKYPYLDDEEQFKLKELLRTDKRENK